MPEQELPNWYEYAARLPSSIPDVAYDAQRGAFFDQYIKPWAYKQNLDETTIRNKFMEGTPRLDKSSVPRIALTVASAARALIDPIAGASGVPEVQEMLRAKEEGASVEAQRQGINPIPYSLIGSMAGQVPYWYAGMELAGLAAKTVAAPEALEATRRLFNVAAGAAVQGGYDAAKSSDGHRMLEGTLGAIEGAAGVAAIEYAKPLWKVLRGVHGLEESSAKAVEATAKGVATPEQTALSADVIEKTPEVAATVAKAASEGVSAGKRSGRPSVVDAEPRALRVQVSVEMPPPQPGAMGVASGGAPPHVIPATLGPDEVDKAAELIGSALSKGGSLGSISGDPMLVNALLRKVDDGVVSAGGYDVELQLRGEQIPAGVGGQRVVIPHESEVGVAGDVKVPEPTLTESPTSASPLIAKLKAIMLDPALPADAKRATRVRLQRLSPESLQEIDATQAEPLVRGEGVVSPPPEPLAMEGGGELAQAQELTRKKAKAEGVGQPTGNRLGLEDVSEFDQLEQLQNGKVRDRVSGKLYANADAALRAKGLSAPTRFAVVEPRPLLKDYNTGEPTTYMTERPLGTRVTGDVDQFLPEGTSAGVNAPPGEKPIIFYRNPTPTNMVHESIHADLGHLDLNSHIYEIVKTHPVGSQMVNAFDAPLRKLYGSSWPEEAYAYAASAVRTKNEATLTKFIEADTDRATVLGWIGDNSNSLLQRTATLPDGIHKLRLERRLREVLRRSTGELDTIARDSVALVGDELHMEGGKYKITDRLGTEHLFDSRDGLVDYVEKHYEQPLSAPGLVDESLLPEGLTRYAAEFPPHSLGRVPMEGGLEPEVVAAVSPKPTPGQPKFGAPKDQVVKGGLQNFSYFIRPFFAWAATVAKKNEWPEFYNVLKAVDNARGEMQNFITKHRAPYAEIFDGVSTARRSDFTRYLEAAIEDKPKVASELHISDAEIGKLNLVRNKFFDVLKSEFDIDPETYVQEYVPRLRAANYDPESVKPGGKLTKEMIEWGSRHIRTGNLEPRKTDLLDIMDTYLRNGARDKFMRGPIDAAAELNNLKTVDGEFVTGTLNPLLKRWIESAQGKQDFTGQMIDSAVGAVAEIGNDAIAAINSKLPASMHIESIDSPPREIMNKWILFSSAGQLGYRPMVPFRDFLQTYLTSYPILGGKYLSLGAKAAMREGAFEEAQSAGALVHSSSLLNTETSKASGLMGTAEKVANHSLKGLQWSNNVSRTISYHGHKLRALDAIENFNQTGNVKQLMRDSAMTWLDEPLQKSFVHEISGLKGRSAESVASRIGKELSDVAHWNYSEGATPGIYRYRIGRLFGQYGTWPLNYIEFARRLAMQGIQGDKQEAFKAITRLAIAHGAILKAGHMAGIDTAQWVFTQPLAYGGGPMLQSVTSIAGTMDFETYKGDEARRNVVRPVFPGMIPGGMAAAKIHTAIVKDDPELWKTLLGFVPLREGEEDKGWHQIIP